MDKTLLKNLQGKQHSFGNNVLTYPAVDYSLTGLVHEMNMLQEAAKDLMQPRPEAITHILKMSRAM